MLKIYEVNNRWFVELTEFNLMYEAPEKKEAICKFCDILKTFLINSEQRGKLDKIINDQKER